jgi:hypothetical protein
MNGSENEPFFEASDGEKADNDNKGNNVKQVEQQMRSVLVRALHQSGAGRAYGPDKPDGVGQRDNLGERPDVAGQVKHAQIQLGSKKPNLIIFVNHPRTASE